MFKNYTKIALRNLLRHKVYSFINIFGLAVGLTACLMIFLYIRFELSFDRFHEKADRIYQVHSEWRHEKGSTFQAGVPAPMVPALCDDLPEVLNYVRFIDAKHPVMKYEQKILIRYEEKYFYEDRILFADPSIFEVFTFPMRRGNPATALSSPYSMVLTEEMAEKYFGNEDPIGKTITYDNQFEKFNFTVTGILKNIPPNSHLQFDFLAAMSCAEKVIDLSPPPWNDWRSGRDFKSYVLVSDDFSPSKLETSLSDFAQKYPNPDAPPELQRRPCFQPLTKINLFQIGRQGSTPNTRFTTMLMLAAIAVFILIIACINYMNLATSRFESRTQEIGIRKVVGAQRSSLIQQFMGESILTTFIAFILALLFLEIFLPLFEQLVEEQLAVNYLKDWRLLSSFILITFLVGLFAGCYPALFLSSFRPVSILQRNVIRGKSQFNLRKILVIFQFVISISLISITLIFSRQLNYMRNKQLESFKNQIIVIPLRGHWFQYPVAFKNRLIQHPGILSVSASSEFPGGIRGRGGLRFWWVGNKYSDEAIYIRGFDPQTSFPFIEVDYDFIKTYDLQIIDGRDFSEVYSTDATNAYILNETAVKTIGWKNPIGQTFHSAFAQYKPGKVIGVIRDFHFKPIHEKMEPLVLFIGEPKYLSVKINPSDIPHSLEIIKKLWDVHFPARPFEYFFLDEHFEKLYQSELKIINVFNLSSLLAIILACLGLYGLALFATEKRTKEIGVRKVLGASVSGIVILLSKEFTKWVVLANVFAWPIAYYAMNRWLQNFAYRINIGWWTFLLAGTLALMIALLTVSWQAIRAATANPVESLRYE